MLTALDRDGWMDGRTDGRTFQGGCCRVVDTDVHFPFHTHHLPLSADGTPSPVASPSPFPYPQKFWFSDVPKTCTHLPVACCLLPVACDQSHSLSLSSLHARRCFVFHACGLVLGIGVGIGVLNVYISYSTYVYGIGGVLGGQENTLFLVPQGDARAGRLLVKLRQAHTTGMFL